MKTLNKQKIVYLILLLIGLLQIIGLTPGLQPLRGLGLATVAAPLPLVFSHFRGNETFAADFKLQLLKNEQIVFDQQIDSQMYSLLRGPYNRRNIYGAVFAYGAYLNKPGEVELVQSVLKRGFCDGGPLKGEFGIESDFDTVHIHVHTKTASRQKDHVFGVTCP